MPGTAVCRPETHFPSELGGSLWAQQVEQFFNRPRVEERIKPQCPEFPEGAFGTDIRVLETCNGFGYEPGRMAGRLHGGNEGARTGSGEMRREDACFFQCAPDTAMDIEPRHAAAASHEKDVLGRFHEQTFGQFSSLPSMRPRVRLTSLKVFSVAVWSDATRLNASEKVFSVRSTSSACCAVSSALQETSSGWRT